MNPNPPYRIGTGFDVHRLVPGRKLFLGGVEIPFELGLEGHSDADALLHAVCDAIFGALASGDIGQHFPNNDPRWKDCPSEVFLKEAARLAAGEGYRVVNLDATVLAERPKLTPHKETIRARMASILDLPVNCVGLKATTMEGMGFVGRQEGLAAMAVVMLERIQSSSEPLSAKD